LTASQAGSTIYYTTNGSTPTTSSTVYSAPIVISTNTALKFLAKDSNGNLGPVFTQTYTIDSSIPTVIASPAGGIYNTPQSVTLTASQAGSTIYYTTNGSTPTTSSTVYSKPISITTNSTLKFFAVSAAKTGPIATASYVLDTVAPVVTASPPGGTYTSVQLVTLTPSESSTIYYTTDGSNPTTSSTAYFTPISIASTTTLKFLAKDVAGNIGHIVNETYTISIVRGGGGGGGGGGGSSGGIITAGGETFTYPDSHFVTHPLDRIKLLNLGVRDAQNVALTTAKTGQQVNISATFKNYQNSPQNYVYITEVVKDGITFSLDWQTGAVDTGQTEAASRSWTAGEPGDYVIKVFVWDKLTTSPTALSEIGTSRISVAESAPPRI
jgi:hypothetical protein